ncbi:MAG: membrane protein insertion efficiency factor YidD [Actinobacteria bacterium]|nr:membrane protein insertion efficiency factor YidD [Actinomycetota bacterium]MSW23321.1 membrane protein insertion efficiency factor YidD [Actinomycetota bacterium]MSW75401.1 membrane protein insertion efficiency factor YidD [Actinomycetota bacterium]
MKSLLITVLRFYQTWISPAFPPRCKYYPSCSNYAVKAISTYGLKGIAMSLWRLVRCNPWSNGGVDYVPEKSTNLSNKTSEVMA